MNGCLRGTQPIVAARVVLAQIQFGAIEGRDKQVSTSPILRGSTFIAMMQAADLREGNNVIACGRVAVQDEAVGQSLLRERCVLAS